MVNDVMRRPGRPAGASFPAGRRAAGAVVLTVVLLFAGACGNGAGDTATPGGGSGDTGGDTAAGSLVLTVTFDIEGEDPLKGSVTERSAPTVDGKNPQTCADYAKGSQKSNGKRYFVLPLQLGGRLDGKQVGLQVLVKEYTGPGLYTQEKLTSEGVAFGVRIGNRPYVKQSNGSGSLVTTDADGSGTFSFERLSHSTGADVSPGISGMVRWTCKNV